MSVLRLRSPLALKIPPKDVTLNFHELKTAPRGPSDGRRGKKEAEIHRYIQRESGNRALKKAAVCRWIALVRGDEVIDDPPAVPLMMTLMGHATRWRTSLILLWPRFRDTRRIVWS
jgi:hypothetical protein